MDKSRYHNLVVDVFNHYLNDANNKERDGYAKVEDGKNAYFKWYKENKEKFTLEGLIEYLKGKQGEYKNPWLQMPVVNIVVPTGWSTFLNNHLLPLITLLENDLELEKKIEVRNAAMRVLQQNLGWDDSKTQQYTHNTTSQPTPTNDPFDIKNQTIQNLEDTIEEKEQTITQLQQKILSLRDGDNSAEYIERINALEESLTAKERLIATLSNELKGQKSQNETQAGTFKQQSEKQKQESQQILKELQARLTHVTKALEEEKSKHKALQDSHKDLMNVHANNHTKLAEQLSEKDASIAQLRRTVVEKDAQLAKLRGEVAIDIDIGEQTLGSKMMYLRHRAQTNQGSNQARGTSRTTRPAPQ